LLQLQVNDDITIHFTIGRLLSKPADKKAAVGPVLEKASVTVNRCFSLALNAYAQQWTWMMLSHVVDLLLPSYQWGVINEKIRKASPQPVWSVKLVTRGPVI